MPIVYNDPLRGRPREASRIPAPTSAVLTEQFAQTFEENPIKAGARWYELREQKKHGTPLDAPTARERIRSAGMEGDLTVTDAGITAEALDTLIERKRIEKRRQDVFARAQGGLSEGAARLGVSIATTLADPVSAGLNFVPVVGQARYARWLGRAGSLGGRIAVRAGVGAAEGAAGAAIVEPLIYGSRTAEQADYDAVDSLMNVAFGGLIGTGMHTTVGSLGEVFARAPRGAPGAAVRQPVTPATGQRVRIEPTFDAAADLARAMRPEDFQSTVRAAVGQAIEGRAIDVDAIVNAAIGEIDTRPVSANYAESAIPGLSELPPVAPGSIRFYHGGDTYDGGTRWLTEDPKYALGYAQKEGRTEAKLQYVDVPERMLEQQGINKSYVDDGLPQRAPYVHWDAPEEIARQLKEIPPATSRGAAAKSSVAIDTTRSSRAQSRVVPPARSYDAVDDTVELERYAEETITEDVRASDNTEDVLSASKEEETLATQQLKELYDRLGREVKSAEYDEVIEAATNAERWARTAELATVCLVRGG